MQNLWSQLCSNCHENLKPAITLSPVAMQHASLCPVTPTAITSKHNPFRWKWWLTLSVFGSHSDGSQIDIPYYVIQCKLCDDEKENRDQLQL
jgi:hypothetical protein